MIWLLTSLALAGGTFDPNDIAGASKLYAEAGGSAGQTFQELDDRQSSIAGALRDYQQALDLLGERAPAAERERLDALEKEFNREQAVLGAFASTMMEDFDLEFTAAMERAIAAEGGDLVQCERMVASGPSLPGIPQRKSENPDCKGEDKSPAIAARMDADPALQKAVGEILALEWPALTIAEAPQAPVGGGSQWLGVTPFFQRHLRQALVRIQQADEEAREPFWAAIEDGATKEERQQLLDKARQIDQVTANARRDLAAPILAAVDEATAKLVKKKKAEPTGWCANPALFGGCEGKDVTLSLGGEVAADKKVARLLPQ